MLNFIIVACMSISIMLFIDETWVETLFASMQIVGIVGFLVNKMFGEDNE